MDPSWVLAAKTLKGGRHQVLSPGRAVSTDTVNPLKRESASYTISEDYTDEKMIKRQKLLCLAGNSRSLNPDINELAEMGLLSAEEQGLEGPTSALWLGSIPTSTTTSTLTEMFKSYGPILSTRVLTHKNCGFVNFERVDSADAAKAGMNGKEIFPGAGPVRINFAKPPSASNTPGHDGAFPSPSPDPPSQGLKNAINKAVITPLQSAIISGNFKQFKFILDHDADVNEPFDSNDGRYPIESAAEYGRWDMVRLLLNTGARGKDSGGKAYQYAIQLARKNGHLEVADFLDDIEVLRQSEEESPSYYSFG